MQTKLYGLVALTIITTLSWDGHAAEAIEKSDNQDGLIITVQSDNDFYLAGGDEQYTFGQRLSVNFPEQKEPDWLLNALEWIPLSYGNSRRYNLTFNQQVFTPKNLKTPDIIVSDRPYAAISSFGMGFSNVRDYSSDFFNISLGFTGDMSKGEWAQKTLHSWKGGIEPQGWDNQVGTEATLMVQYYKMLAGDSGAVIGNDLWDFTPYYGISVGSPRTSATAGAAFRIGTGILRENISVPTLSNQIAANDTYYNQKGIAINLVAGIEASGVLYDFSLDGSLFASNPHTVDKKHFTNQAYLGMVVFAGAWRIAYTQVFQSKMYNTQAKRHQYGAISVSRHF